MIRRIVLQNYMSHSHSEIELAAGLTVLVGPNNSGKSAIVSALETLCTNAKGDYMERHNEKDTRVIIHTDDHVVEWRRRKNIVSYVIDGREIHRPKNDILKELHKLLRLPKVEAGEKQDGFDIHFGTQKSPIFLLNESGSRAALFFASSSDAATLLEMQKRHRDKVKERKTEDRRLRDELSQLDAKLAVLKPLEKLATSVTQLEAQHEELRCLEDDIQSLCNTIELLNSISLGNEQISQLCKWLGHLKPTPDLVDTSSFTILISELLDTNRQLERESVRSAVLGNLSFPPAIEDPSVLTTTVQALSNAEQDFAIWLRRSAITKDLAAPPALHHIESLDTMCSTISQERESRRILMARGSVLRRLNEPPSILQTGSLERMVSKLGTSHKSVLGILDKICVLSMLRPPPVMMDTQPLKNLIIKMNNLQTDIGTHQNSLADTKSRISKLELKIPGVKPAGPQTWRNVVLNLKRISLVPVLILLIATGSRWIIKPNTEVTSKTSRPTESDRSAIAKVEKSATSEIMRPTESDRSAIAKVEKSATSEIIRPSESDRSAIAKAENSNFQVSDANATHATEIDPKSDSRDQVTLKKRQDRLRQLRLLIDNAEEAERNGRYLDAVLGFGQAALFFQEELPEVQNPASVRIKFIDALNHLQSEVEHSFDEALKTQSAGTQSTSS